MNLEEWYTWLAAFTGVLCKKHGWVPGQGWLSRKAKHTVVECTMLSRCAALQFVVPYFAAGHALCCACCPLVLREH